MSEAISLLIARLPHLARSAGNDGNFVKIATLHPDSYRDFVRNDHRKQGLLDAVIS
jgi:hypothetical protein